MWTQKHRYSMWKTTFGINCKFKWTYTTIIKSLQTTFLKFYWIFGFLLLLPYSTCLYQNPWISLLLLAFKFIWCIADSSRRRSAFKAITTSTLSWPYSVYRVHWLLQHTYTVHHHVTTGWVMLFFLYPESHYTGFAREDSGSSCITQYYSWSLQLHRRKYINKHNIPYIICAVHTTPPVTWYRKQVFAFLFIASKKYVLWFML